MRKHHSRPVAVACRVLWAWSYLRGPSPRVILPGHDARRYWLHARQALRPTRGEGMREAAEAYNLQLARHERAPRAAQVRSPRPVLVAGHRLVDLGAEGASRRASAPAGAGAALQAAGSRGDRGRAEQLAKPRALLLVEEADANRTSG